MLQLKYQVTPQGCGGTVLTSYGIAILTQLLVSGSTNIPEKWMKMRLLIANRPCRDVKKRWALHSSTILHLCALLETFT